MKFEMMERHLAESPTETPQMHTATATRQIYGHALSGVTTDNKSDWKFSNETFANRMMLF
jgi:hypothetical protein